MKPERTKLKAAREEKGRHEGRHLSQKDVAERIGCNRDTVGLWERGMVSPENYWIDKLCKFYSVTDPRDLDLIPSAPILTLEEIVKMLEKYDRREVIAALQKLSVFASVDLLALLDAPSNGAPEGFLEQCDATLGVCWELLGHSGHAMVKSVLAKYEPTLLDLTKSRHRDEAASLMTQVKIMQIRVAHRNRDFSSCKTLGLQALRFGELSKDPFLYLAAALWHGDTYVYCYHLPSKAIPILQEGLGHVNSDTPLNKSALCSNLAIAHAQAADEANALISMEQARNVAPKYPEEDQAYQYVQGGQLDKMEGRMCLALAEKLPGYPRLAYDILHKASSKSPPNSSELSQVLIHQADAAFLLGDLDEYIRCLTEAARLAFDVGGLNRQHQARVVLHKAPEKWHKEPQYQELVKMF
jgi:transcriptional regulator with XRE-family HTH domain